MNTYLQNLLDGKHGPIIEKHKKLATLIRKQQPTMDSPGSLIRYCSRYKKYNDWSLRDYHLSLAYSTK